MLFTPALGFGKSDQFSSALEAQSDPAKLGPEASCS